MVDESIRQTIKDYLRALNRAGIKATRAVVFGSRAQGRADEWSDIDLVVIAPELDGNRDSRIVNLLWELRAETDSRIEPIPCGEREWESDTARPILEIARRQGEMVAT
ncbi:MAG TPA: nucleotidyltransferase domain-containing protein [Candidatus Brocadiia bacterium]|nr:nucleotidyltransferase domain-containing protein [Candidatus Brocadiia bacterium]